MIKRIATLVLSAAIAYPAMAGTRVDLTVLDQDANSPRTQVLVLGSVHMNQMQEKISPASLQPLLEKLAAFKPQIITVEAIPGESCHMMAQYPALYDPDELSPYCSATQKARAATGLDLPSAVTEVKKTLANWPVQPTPVQRRHLAALFLASSDGASALVQWLQLAPAERHPGDGLDAALVAQLEGEVTAQSESYQIGARLAARLGLQRVFPIDDHTGDNVDVKDARAYGQAIQRAWDSARATAAPMRSHKKELAAGGDMLALYRYINRPDVLQVAINSDFGAAMRDRSPEHYGQIYVAGWETRNLRMVANVHGAFRERPGARVLSVVGSSHKPWFDSLLGQMQGVDVVDAENVLGPAPK